MTAARVSAALLALMAAGLVWIGAGATAGMAGAGALALAGLLALWAGAPRRLSALALALLAVVPAALVFWMVSGGGAQVALWPGGVAALAAALAILSLADLRGTDPLPWACMPLGAALLAGLGVLAALAGGPELLLAAVETATRSPVHVALFAVAAALVAGLAIAALDGTLAPGGAAFLRALIGLLPLLGFTGTVLGIMQALGALPDLFATGAPDGAALAPMLAGLATAFETTLIGLVAAVIAGGLLALIEAVQAPGAGD